MHVCVIYGTALVCSLARALHKSSHTVVFLDDCTQYAPGDLHSTECISIVHVCGTALVARALHKSSHTVMTVLNMLLATRILQIAQVSCMCV